MAEINLEAPGSASKRELVSVSVRLSPNEMRALVALKHFLEQGDGKIISVADAFRTAVGVVSDMVKAEPLALASYLSPRQEEVREEEVPPVPEPAPVKSKAKKKKDNMSV